MAHPWGCLPTFSPQSSGRMENISHYPFFSNCSHLMCTFVSKSGLKFTNILQNSFVIEHENSAKKLWKKLGWWISTQLNITNAYLVYLAIMLLGYIKSRIRIKSADAKSTPSYFSEQHFLIIIIVIVGPVMTLSVWSYKIRDL